jgi:uncharacterized protein (DUF2147 family)
MLNKSFAIICALLILPIISAVAQTEAADKIIGTYYVSDDTSDEDCKVKITKDKSGTYSGRIIWVKNPNFKDGTPKRDIKNPDPAKRSTPGDQIPLVFHFRYDAKKNQWVDGEIYDPIHGKMYKCKMWFESENVLRVRGYIGVPALGRTMTWKKLS